ncbi:MAG TPA: LPS assembly lipoprotein LptE [Burkholderiaceae bacterium]|nr:LPS assembly lipoprotein LptE [Burkholderiaceae bacterium]
MSDDSRASPAKVLRRRLLFATAALLGGCGFELRHPPTVQFSTIALAGFAPRSPMADELRRELQSVTRVVEVPKDAQVVLQALIDRRERVVVATTTAGQVRQLQLRVRFRFRLESPGGRELLAPDELMLWREISYNETNALAKEEEEGQVYRALQSDIVAQVMRRLGALKT